MVFSRKDERTGVGLKSDQRDKRIRNPSGEDLRVTIVIRHRYDVQEFRFGGVIAIVDHNIYI